MLKILQKTENWILATTVFLVPIVILPIFPNVFSTGKLFILTFGIAATLLIKTIKIISRGSLKLTVGNYDLGMILLASAYVASTALRTPNKMEAILLPGTTTLLVGCTLLYFLINQGGKHGKDLVKNALILSGVVLSIVSLFAIANVGSTIPQLPEYAKLPTFSLTGSSISQGMLLATLLPLTISEVIGSASTARKTLYGIAATLIGFGLIISIFNSMPGKPTSPRLHSLNTSWVIGIETIKVNPFFGIGPGNYLTAFNQYRPLSYNSTDLWAIRFTTGRTFPLTLLTETGLVGATALLIIGIATFKHAKKLSKKIKDGGLSIIDTDSIGAQLSLATIIVLLLILPSSHITLLVLFALFALTSKTSSTDFGIPETPASKKGSKTNIPALITVLPVVALLVIYGFYAQKLLAAEYTFNQALKAVTRNDGRETYRLLQEAITKNPTVDRYHSSYAQVNLALANSIAQKPDITDEDRQNISQLIQQAIREGKNAVALNPQRANSWEILASIYRAIIPLAEGADQFAAQTYNQAATLDPGNPNTRIALGGLFYAAGNYQSAIDIFSLATRVKPDHANAHYNLASAYREAGQVDAAIREMSVVLSLVGPGSDDFNLASKELEALQTKRAQTQGQQGSTNLTTPESQVPTDPSLNPPLELPEDAEPELNPSPLP